LLSDGTESIGVSPGMFNALPAVRTAGIRVLTVTYGTLADINLSNMRRLATTEADFFYAPSGADLGLIYGYLAGSLCRNLPPIANAGLDFNVFQPATTTLTGAASDDGSPGLPLTTQWSQVSGPGQVSLATPNALITAAVFPQPGVYVLRLTVSDSVTTVTDDVTVTVVNEASLAGATLTLTTANATTNQANTSVTMTATLRNASNQPIPNFGIRLELVGANAPNVPFATGATDLNGQFAFSYVGTNTGADGWTATANSTLQSLSSNQLQFNWTTDPATVPPVVTGGWIGFPVHQGIVREPIKIRLSINVTINKGTLYLCQGTNPPTNCRQLADNLVVGPGGVIADFDPTAIPNGPCIVRLDACDTAGNRQVSEVLFNVVGENKPGRVALSLNEFTVPAAGIPLTIARKYDSLERDVLGDFGYGWSLAVYATRLQVAPDQSVTFTDPASGRRVNFGFTPRAFGGLMSFLYEAGYTGEPGVYGKLTDDGCGLLYQSGRQFRCTFSNTYAPTTYTYTDPYGREYVMGADGKLQSIKDLNGNTLTITANGITSSTGLNVVFQRDAQGRITQITDTTGKVYKYNYSAAGDLDNVELPPNPTPAPFRPTYTYSPDHSLLTAKDARGNTEAVMTYFPDGRLQTVTDAENQTTSYAYDLVNRTTTITAPDAGVSVKTLDSYGMTVAEKNALNEITTFEYNATHDLITETNAIGQVTRYTYDARGHRTVSLRQSGVRRKQEPR
jgi:YD repeat-containing protein